MSLQNPPVKITASKVDDFSGDFSVAPQDLDLLESRVQEIERYLGIQDMDLDYFLKEEGEDLKNKSTMLEDFMHAAEDKCFCIKDLNQRYEKLEPFLKH